MLLLLLWGVCACVCVSWGGKGRLSELSQEGSRASPALAPRAAVLPELPGCVSGPQGLLEAQESVALA